MTGSLKYGKMPLYKGAGGSLTSLKDCAGPMSTTMSAAMDILNRTVTAHTRGHEDDSDPVMTTLQRSLQAQARDGKLNREEVRDILTRMVLLQTAKAKGFEFRECVKLVLDLQGLKADGKRKGMISTEAEYPDLGSQKESE